MELQLAAVVSVIINGALIGGVYGLTSSAFTFQSGALKFSNFAYGTLIMLSMYFTYFGIKEWGIPVPLTVLMVLTINVLLGMLLRKTVLKKDAVTTQILCTMGVSLIILNLVTYFFTSLPRTMAIFETRISLFMNDITIGTTQLLCFVFAAVILIGFHFFLTKTWTGRAIRAVVQNKEIASTMGINSERIMDIAFSFSCLLIGLSGIMLMIMFQVDPNFGNYIQTIAFLVCISAGLGNLSGAFFSGIIVGILSALITYLLGAKWHNPVLFGLFVLVLLLRPYGIFNSKKNVARNF